MGANDHACRPDWRDRPGPRLQRKVPHCLLRRKRTYTELINGRSLRPQLFRLKTQLLNKPRENSCFLTTRFDSFHFNPLTESAESADDVPVAFLKWRLHELTERAKLEISRRNSDGEELSLDGEELTGGLVKERLKSVSCLSIFKRLFSNICTRAAQSRLFPRKHCSARKKKLSAPTFRTFAKYFSIASRCLWHKLYIWRPCWKINWKLIQQVLSWQKMLAYINNRYGFRYDVVTWMYKPTRPFEYNQGIAKYAVQPVRKKILHSVNFLSSD